VLHDIGMTVAIGALLSLISSAILTTARSPAPLEDAAEARRSAP